MLAVSSVEAFHPKRSIVGAGGDAIDVVEFARASVVGRKREDGGDADAPLTLTADTPAECSSPIINSRRRNEEEGSDDLEDSDVGGGREFSSIHRLHTSPLFYGHH